MASGRRRRGPRTRAMISESGKVVVAAPRSCHSKDSNQSGAGLGGNHPFPCMPCVNQDEQTS